jgi:hypothetical protein
MTDENLRRLLPPPHRRPSPVDLVIRWRFEIVVAVVVAAAWHALGGRVMGVGALLLAAALLAAPGARRCAVGLLQALIVPHRVRSGLVQAGVGNRSGRLPWLVAARPHGDTVRVTVWLRAGTSLDDLVRAAPLVATACGAQTVDVERYSARQDRAVLVVVRPRWGWWTR